MILCKILLNPKGWNTSKEAFSQNIDVPLFLHITTTVTKMEQYNEKMSSEGFDSPYLIEIDAAYSDNMSNPFEHLIPSASAKETSAVKDLERCLIMLERFDRTHMMYQQDEPAEPPPTGEEVFLAALATVGLLVLVAVIIFLAETALHC